MNGGIVFLSTTAHPKTYNTRDERWTIIRRGVAKEEIYFRCYVCRRVAHLVNYSSLFGRVTCELRIFAQCASMYPVVTWDEKYEKCESRPDGLPRIWFPLFESSIFRFIPRFYPEVWGWICRAETDCIKRNRLSTAAAYVIWSWLVDGVHVVHSQFCCY